MILVQASPTQVTLYINDYTDNVDWAKMGKGARVAVVEADVFGKVKAWQEAASAGTPAVPGTAAVAAVVAQPNATPPVAGVAAVAAVAPIPAVLPALLGNQIAIDATGTLHFNNPDGTPATETHIPPGATVAVTSNVTARARVIAG
jgi:hypothetical protein